MNALANAMRRISPNRITGLPGQLQPDDDVGLFIACKEFSAADLRIQLMRQMGRRADKLVAERIAITIDDLPWAATNDGGWQANTSDDSLRIARHHKQLMVAMKRAKAPVVGFVNEGKLYANGWPHLRRLTTSQPS